MDSTCPDISRLTTSFFLKMAMFCQFLCGLLSILSLIATYRRTFSSYLLDIGFREHLICVYLLHFIQGVALALLTGIHLFQHLFQPTCFGTIPSTLCYCLRFATVFSVFSLPLFNLTLTLFRVISFFGGKTLKRQEGTIRRIITGLTIIATIVEFWWKVNDVTLPPGDVAYCTANSQSFAQKASVENIFTGSFEFITIVTAFLLIRLYKRENRLRRSYNVSVNLTRRQLYLSMQLFLPYSVFHAFCFVAFSSVSIGYRAIFVNLPEPYYSAGSAFTFIPMYFTVISPWIAYWIVGKSERSRIDNTNNLLNLENQAENLYFANYRSQWEFQRKPESKSILPFHTWDLLKCKMSFLNLRKTRRITGHSDLRK